MSELSDTQYEALRWIGRNRCTSSEWTTSGKPARRGPETWTHMLMKGPSGSILVAKSDFRAILPYVTNGPFSGPDSSIHALSDLGRSALSETTGEGK